MRRILLFSILALSIGISAIAQKLNESDVPSSVKASFAKLYPGISPKWEKEGSNYEAGFKKSEKVMAAVFTANGNLVESEVSIKVEELPSSALTYIKTSYKDKKIAEAAKITKADGTINYEAEVEGRDVIFDSNGKFIREAKD